MGAQRLIYTPKRTFGRERTSRRRQNVDFDVTLRPGGLITAL